MTADTETWQMTAHDAARLLSQIIKPLHEAGLNIGREKELARAERDPLMRHYKLGLADGCELTIAQVVGICDRFLAEHGAS